MEEEKTKQKRKKYSAAEIKSIAAGVVRDLKSGSDDFSDVQKKLTPAEYASLLGDIRSKLTGDSVKSAQFRSLLATLDKDLPAKIWRKVYINSIRLGAYVMQGEAEQIRLVKDALSRYGKYHDELQKFSEELGNASRLLTAVLRDHLDEKGPAEAGASPIAYAWAIAFQPLLSKKMRNDRGIQVVSQEDADEILGMLSEMEKNSGASGLSCELLNLLPIVALHASEQGRQTFSDSKPGKRLGMSGFAGATGQSDAVAKDLSAAAEKMSRKSVSEGEDIFLVKQFIHVLTKSIDAMRKLPHLQSKFDQSEGGRKEAEKEIRTLERRIEDISGKLGHLESEKKDLAMELESERRKLREAEQAEHHVTTVAGHEMEELRHKLEKVMTSQGAAALRNMEDMDNSPNDKTMKMLKANLSALVKRVCESAGIEKPALPNVKKGPEAELEQ